VVNSTK